MDGGRPYHNDWNSNLQPFTNLVLRERIQPRQKSKIQNNKTLTKKAIETLLDELFTLDKEKNEQLMEQYANDNDIMI